MGKFIAGVVIGFLIGYSMRKEQVVSQVTGYAQQTPYTWFDLVPF
jgi:uncharacterized membrane protein (Fun14 family)